MENRLQGRHVFVIVPLFSLTLYVDIWSHSLELVALIMDTQRQSSEDADCPRGGQLEGPRNLSYRGALGSGSSVCTRERWRRGHGREEQMSGARDDGAAPVVSWPPR